MGHNSITMFSTRLSRIHASRRTSIPAKAATEDHTGRIAVGYTADLVVVDRPLETADDAFAATVDITMVGGAVVHTS